MLVGLHGPAQSGKDTVYGILRTLSFSQGEAPLLPYLVRRDAFADRLKVSAARALGFDGDWDECIEIMNRLKTEGFINTIVDLHKRKEISGREYLQRYGTEAHREVFAQDFWVKAVLPEGYPSDDEHHKTLLVVTDVRFPNEAERVLECGGQMWKIDRPVERIAESAHASETPLDDKYITHTILNYGGVEALAVEVTAAAIGLVP